MDPGGVTGRPEETPVRRGLWVYSVAVVAAALVIVPVADDRPAFHPNLINGVFVLMAAADLLTAYLLVQQFLAGGRLATLGLSSVYLYSSLMMVPCTIVFAGMQRVGSASTRADVCSPWLFVALFGGFPVLVVAQQRVIAALPARLSEQARARRPVMGAAAAAAVLALVSTVTGTIIGAADWLPRLYQDDVQTPAGRYVLGTVLLTTAASLVAVARDLRHRPSVEHWVMVAISATLGTAILGLAAPHRYTLGWHAARVTMLISSGVVLLALLAETASLYRRLSAAHEDLDHAHRELSRRAEHLAAANLELEAAGIWKSDILATLSHEINQPLAVISACSEELTHEWDTSTDDERRAAAQALGGRVSQLLDMAAHLLELCRAEPGDIRTQPEALPVEQVLARVTDNLTKHARERVTASYGLSGTAVWADPVHTHEVLTNFVTNAVKYSPGDIYVSATLDDTGNDVLFAVSDEGKGVPPDFVAHLFDRFTQAEQPGGARNGAGFGLYLSRLLAEANQGQIWYEDVVPHGGRFMLRLPRAQLAPETTAVLDLVDGATTT